MKVWRFLDFQFRHITYHLSLCKPLSFDNEIYLSKCNGSYFCMENLITFSADPLYMGKEAPPVFTSKEGELFVLFADTPCQAHKNHSIYINLICKHEESLPRVIHYPNLCRFIVTLPSEAACPSAPEEKDSGPCFVKDPTTGAQYSLSSLNKPQGYPVKDLQSKSTYLINVCAPLGDGAPAKCQGLGVCDLSSNGTVVMTNLGYFNSDLKIGSDFVKKHFKNQLQLIYEAEDPSCENGVLRTELGFYCRENEELGPFLYSGMDRCNLKIMWITPAACPRGTHVLCHASDSLTDATYDLSSLAQENTDYSVQLRSNHEHPKIVLNVCRSLVKRYPVSNCYWTDGACLITDQQWHISFGNPSTPIYENDSLIIYYNSSQSCNLDPSMKSSLIVHFECDPNAFNTKPNFSYRTQCSYHLSWTTAAACPIASYKTPSELMHPNNPATGYVYYMNPVEFSNATISLDPLSQIQIQLWPKMGTGTTACGFETAVCLVENLGASLQKTTSLGRHKGASLHHEEGMLAYVFPITISYTKDSPTLCQSTVRLICRNVSETDSKPFLASNESCQYEFFWPTQAVCESRSECEAIRKDTTFDLRPLINVKNNFEILDPQNSNITYYLSLCGPLVPLPETAGCPPNSAACLVDNGMNQSLSLGYAGENIKFDEEEHAYLAYDYGQPCSESTQYSSKIVFICAPLLGKGYPTITSFDQTSCVVSFTWRTSFVCTTDELNQALTYPDRCKYYNPLNETEFNLGLIPPANYTNRKWGETLMVHPCGAISTDRSHPCFGSSICLAAKEGILKPFGNSRPLFSFDEKTLSVEYLNGELCDESENDGRTSAIITFICDYKQKVVWKRLGACRISISYRTHLACRPTSYHCSNVYALPFRLEPFTSDSHVWSATDLSSNEYYTNLCAPIHEIVPKCPPSSAVCMYNARTNEFQSIGNLFYQKIKRVRAKASNGRRILGALTVTAIEYMENGTCQNNQPYYTKILLECDYKTHGALILKSRPNECTFVFEFKTNHACRSREDLAFFEPYIYSKKAKVMFNLQPLIETKFNINSFRSTPNRYFTFSLGQEQMTAGCLGASICEVNVTGSFSQRRNIGSHPSKKYHAYGRLGSYQSSLALLSRGEDRCPTAPGGYYSSHIHLVCLGSARPGKPKFLYMDKGCTYYFEWPTDRLCDFNAMRRSIPGWIKFVQKLRQNLYITTPLPEVSPAQPSSGEEEAITTQPSDISPTIPPSSHPDQFRTSPYLLALYATLGMLVCMGLSILGLYIYQNTKNPYRRSLFWNRFIPFRRTRHMHFYRNVNTFDDTLMDTYSEDAEQNEL